MGEEKSKYIDCKRIWEELHPNALNALYERANKLYRTEQPALAREQYEKHLEQSVQVYGENDVRPYYSLLGIGKTLALEKDYKDALLFVQEAYDKLEELGGFENSVTFQALEQLADINYCLGNYEEALRLDMLWYDKMKLLFGEEDEKSLKRLNHIGQDYFKLKKYDKALEVDNKYFEESLKKYGLENEITLIALNNVACDYSDLGDYEKSYELHKKCYDIKKRIYGEDSKDTKHSLNKLKELEDKMNK